MTEPSTIAVAYASVGSGHRIAAEAVAEEIERRNSGFSAKLIDALCSTSHISGETLSQTFVGPTSGIYDTLWRSPAAGSLARALGTPVLRAVLNSCSRDMAAADAAAVVATHAAPAVLAANRALRDEQAPVLVSVATDFEAHTFWPSRGVARFCVADDQSRADLISRGFSDEQVIATGIPVRQQFMRDYDRQAALHHFGLPSDQRILLALAGSMMAGPYERLKGALAVSLPALASLPNTSVVIVTGRDEAFAEELRVRAHGFGTTNVRVLGFVDRMAPLMSCADLIIAKPGGVVCAESLAVGVPMILVGPAAGQERANSRALAELGAASFTSDSRLLAESVRKIATKPARLARMREAASGAGRPFAASDVVDQTLKAIEERRDRQGRG